MDPNSLAAHAQKLIDLLLRYVVPGAASVLAFGAVQTPPFAFLRVAGSTDVSSWLMLLYVVVVGPAIYAIHRGVLHQGLARILILLAKRRYRSTLSVTELDNRMSDALASWRQGNDKWVPTYEAWSAQIHFLYCSAWGIGAALALHYLIDPMQLGKHFAIGTVIASLLFIMGFISDGRLTQRQLSRTLAP